MKITEKTLENIDKRYSTEYRKKSEYKYGLGINVRDSMEGAGIFKNNWHICDIEELTQMIDELTDIRDAIKDVTGFEF